jgi:colicin import membrane protein
MLRPACFPLLACLLLGTLASAPAADNKKDKEDIAVEKHKKVLQDAHNRVESEQKQMAQAKAAVDKAQDAVRKERTEGEKIRKAAIEEQDSQPQLVKARQEVELAENQFKTASAPILTRLAQDAGYQTLVRDRDAKRQQLQSAPGNAKEQFASAALAAAAAVTKSEQTALAADATAAAAKKKLEEVRTKLQLLIDERDRKIAQDPHIQRAAAEFAGAKKQLDSAQDAAEKAARELATAQKHLQQEQQEHNRLVAAEKADDARDKAAAQKKNNPKKK